MNKLFLILSLSFLVGCTAAKYQEYNCISGGYNVAHIAKNEFVLGFSSGLFGEIDDGKRNQYLLRQAAEQTLIRGYTHFVRSPFDRFNQFVRCYYTEEAPFDAYDARVILK